MYKSREPGRDGVRRKVNGEFEILRNANVDATVELSVNR